MKTLNDYMTDPRILDDEEMMAAPEPVREVHAARLKIQDETAGMSAAERNAYYQKKSANFFDKLGITPQYVNFSGQGRVAVRNEAARVSKHV
jgi:hypothetical protein